MRVYIAYRYNDVDAGQVLANIGVAHKVGYELIKENHFPFIPHADCILATMFGKNLPLDYYYRASLEWLRQCEAICVVLDGKKLSPGVLREIEEAKRLKMKFFVAIVNPQTGEIRIEERENARL